MGREVRRVPANWHHPKNGFTGRYIPLRDNFNRHFKDWTERNKMWEKGYIEKWSLENFEAGKTEYITKEEHDADVDNERWLTDKYPKYSDYAGACPDKEYYMPDFPPEERTHYQMYETCSEGTPISPVFELPEELAEWLVANSASFFGKITATYDHWLAIAKDEDCGLLCVEMVDKNGE